jgi:hypothetical protein
VWIPNFVDRNLCEQVIEHYQRWSKLRWNEWPEDPREQEKFIAAIDRASKLPKKLFAIRQDDPWMFNFVTQRKLGEAAARFLKVHVIKALSETLQVKYPLNSGHSKPLA